MRGFSGVAGGGRVGGGAAAMILSFVRRKEGRKPKWNVCRCIQEKAEKCIQTPEHVESLRRAPTETGLLWRKSSFPLCSLNLQEKTLSTRSLRACFHGPFTRFIFCGNLSSERGKYFFFPKRVPWGFRAVSRTQQWELKTPPVHGEFTRLYSALNWWPGMVWQPSILEDQPCIIPGYNEFSFRYNLR